MRSPQPSECRRELPVEFGGAKQQFPRLGVRLFRVAPPQFTSPQETVESLHIVGLLGHQPTAIALCEVERKRAHDLPGHVILHGENVGQVPIEPLRPEMAVIGGVDELSRDPDALVDFAHAALEHIAGPEKSCRSPGSGHSCP